MGPNDLFCNFTWYVLSKLYQSISKSCEIIDEKSTLSKFNSDFTKIKKKSGWLKYDLNDVLVPLCNIFVTKWSYLIAPTTSYLLVHHQKVIAEQSRFYA